MLVDADGYRLAGPGRGRPSHHRPGAPLSGPAGATAPFGAGTPVGRVEVPAGG